jgi:hypothetical protein
MRRFGKIWDKGIWIVGKARYPNPRYRQSHKKYIFYVLQDICSKLFKKLCFFDTFSSHITVT